MRREPFEVSEEDEMTRRRGGDPRVDGRLDSKPV